ncbi:MAG: DUF3084 domain-containing protein [Synechococcaceae cyanobacterium SM2_3_1]|nr:DUF3084 domain-containing protein [Synechococcaceae cyanobacterium SM2_3_1]
MQGILLILTILIASGLIAVVGDRVGYRIGKKRLSWFQLRPRHTAILVAVITGVTISALTLATLLLLNRTLRDALFNYQRVVSTYELYLTALNQQVEIQQNQLSSLETNLEEVTTQRGDAQERLAQLLEQRDEASTRLEEVTTSLEKNQEQLENLKAELAAAQAQLLQAQEQRQQAQAQLDALKADAATTQTQVSQLETQLQELNATKEVLQLDRDQLERSLNIAQQALERLSSQKQGLEQDIEQLQQISLRLRRGELSIMAGEILSRGVIKPPEPKVAPLPSLIQQNQLRQQVNLLLSQAEQRARQLGARPQPPLPNAVQLRRESLEELLQRLSQPGEWVVRIFSVSNLLKGEPVPVIADIHPNRLLYREGEVLVKTVIRPGQSPDLLQSRLLGLLSEANVLSQQAGLLADPLTGTVGEFSQVKLLEAVQQLQLAEQDTEVRVVSDRDIYSAGPLAVSFVMQQTSQPEEEVSSVSP